MLMSQQGTNSRNKEKGTTAYLSHATNHDKAAMPVSIDSAWIHYDDMDNYDSWGFLISGEEYDVVAKWDPQDITNYDGWEITKVKFIVVSSTPYIDIKIFEGTDYTEIYSQSVDSYNVNTWTEVTLDTPVLFDVTKELYVGYHVDMTHTELGGFVTATDDGPPIDEYGNLVRWNGSWYSDFNNHNLQVLIEANLNAEFEADATVICMGGTVNFTNLSTAEESYVWTFEGGTPASSTDENPSVTYSTPGIYDVTLEVSAGTETDTEYKQDYIYVLDIPAQADTPVGEDSVCTGQVYAYTINPVLYSQDYEWELSPASAGTLTPDDTTASLWVADDWTGDFTIRVRATNMCGDGTWSADFTGTVFQSPTVFALEGETGYCLGDDGAELTLSGSETGIDYELYLDGVATGNVVAGTGSEFSFELVTDEGVYSAIASSATCDIVMDNQVTVEILFPPLEPETPTGPDVICTETFSDYSSDGSEDADSYMWILEPEEAGSITFSDLSATVEWNADFYGIAWISLYGVNDCGEGNPSTALEISIGTPNPVINGQDVVCDWSNEVYEVEGDTTSTYTWEVTGGSITEGQGTNMITVAWEGEGLGNLTVTQETPDGCSGSSDLFEVTVDDCTGINTTSGLGIIKLFPNPANDFVNIRSSSTINQIVLYTPEGNLIFDYMLHQTKYKLNTSVLRTGIYIVKISTEKGEVIIKLVIE